MKKIMRVILLGSSIFILSACGSKVTKEVLEANQWEVNFGNDDEAKFIADFSDDVMNLSFDTSSLASEASNEWEEIGEGLAKSFLGNMSYEVKYELKGDSIHLKNKGLDLDNSFAVSKKGTDVIFTNKKNKDKTLVLKPQKKDKNKKAQKKERESSATTTTSLTKSSSEESSKQSSESESIVNSESPIDSDSLPINNNKMKTKDLEFTINKASIIPVGEKGNEYGDVPVLAIWYTTTNNSDRAFSPLAWVSYTKVIQDNDPNKVNELRVASTPDEAFLNDQSAEIKKGGSLKSAVAYELSDETTDVEIKISDYFEKKEAESVIIKLK